MSSPKRAPFHAGTLSPAPAGPDQILAPWTPDQVRALNTWQEAGSVHPFTCGQCGATLRATSLGWGCDNDTYRQTWAHRFMTDPATLASLRPSFSTTGDHA